MDFLGFLRGLFGGGGGNSGGGQSASAPPPMIARPQNPPNSRMASLQDTASATPSGRLPIQEPSRQQSAPAAPPRWQPGPAAPAALAGFQPPPAALARFQPPPAALDDFRAPTAMGNLQADKEAKEKQSNFFGAEGEYAPEQMSVDAYLQLEPRQRAAVDANTALVQAAEQDIASWAKSNIAGKPIDDKNYLDQVNQSFGETGGSDTYAPRTMAVLQDLGLNLEGRDLDQYLNRSALVTASDLDTIRTGAEPVSGDVSRQNNAVAFSSAASNRLSETLASGQTLLDSIRTGSDANRQLFGAPATTAPPLGFNTQSERDADLRQAFDIFAQAQSQQDLTPETVSGVYSELQAKHGVTPNEVAQYFETRLQANEYLNVTGGDPVTLGGPGKSLEYLAPEDFRSKFLTRGA